MERVRFIVKPVSLLILLFGIGLTIGLFGFCRKAIYRTVQGEFEKTALSKTNEISGQVERCLALLHSLRCFYNYSDSIQPKEFDGFVSVQMQSCVGLEAVLWVPFVQADSRDVYESTARMEGFESFSFLGSGLIREKNLPEYYPIYYACPLKQNLGIIGYDLQTEADVKQLFEMTLKSDRPEVLCKPYPILMQNTHQEGIDFWIAVPVYRPHTVSCTESDRRANLQGYLIGVVDFHQLSKTFQNASFSGVHIEISDITNSHNPILLYRSELKSGQMRELFPLQAQQNVQFLGKTMKIDYIDDSGHYWQMRASVWQAWAVLIGGSLLNGLLILYLHNLYQRNELADRLVEKRTSQLKEQKDKADRIALEAERANKAKSEFLATMSHDIRTPMNAIIGFCDLLNEECLSSDQQHYVKIIHESSHNLLLLINDILDLSKIEAGRLHLDYIDCDLKDLLNQVKTLLSPSAVNRGLDFQWFVSPSVPANVRIDPLRIRQCLVNLIGNAIKFTHTGHIYVRVSQQGEVLQFLIEDTGIGITQDKQNTIFDAFTQAEDGTSRQYGGSGLGLTITRQLARLMGGDVTLSSQPGQGSVFSLTVPLQVDSQVLESGVTVGAV